MSQMIKLKDIERTGWNPREINPKDEDVQKMVTSMQEVGQLIDILVREKPGTKDKYQLADGDLRLTSAEILKWKEIKAEIREFNDLQLKEIMLITSVDKNKLNPIEEAKGIQQVLDEGVRQEDLAKKMGKTQGWISNRIRLLEAPRKMLDWIKSGYFTTKHVMVMLSFKKLDWKKGYDELMERLGDYFKQDRAISVSELEEMISTKIQNTLNEAGALPYYTCIKDKGYNREDFKKHFDIDHCKKECKKIIEHKNKKYCLDKICFEKKILEAYAKSEAVLKEKIAKEAKKAKKPSKTIEAIRAKVSESKKKGEQPSGKREVLDTKKCMSSDYNKLALANFDKKECKECGLNMISDKKEEVCIDPTCFANKIKEQIKKENLKTTTADRKVKEAVTLFFSNEDKFLSCLENVSDKNEEKLLRDTIYYIMDKFSDYSRSCQKHARLPTQRYTKEYIDEYYEFKMFGKDLSLKDIFKLLVETILYMRMEKDWKEGYKEKYLKEASPYIHKYFSKTSTNELLEDAGQSLDLPHCIFCHTQPIVEKDADKMTHVYCPMCGVGITPIKNTSSAKASWKKTYDSSSYFDKRTLKNFQAGQYGGAGINPPKEESPPAPPKKKTSKAGSKKDPADE